MTLDFDLCCGDPADCEADCEARAASVLDQPYFDAEGNEGTIGEVHTA